MLTLPMPGADAVRYLRSPAALLITVAGVTVTLLALWVAEAGSARIDGATFVTPEPLPVVSATVEFDYFPSHYVNGARDIEAHVEAF